MFFVCSHYVCCLYFFIGKLASEIFGEVHRNDLNVQFVLSASTDSHASFFSGAWEFVNFLINY